MRGSLLRRSDLPLAFLLALLLATASQLPPAVGCFATQPFARCLQDGPNFWLRSLFFFSIGLGTLGVLHLLLARVHMPRGLRRAVFTLLLAATHLVTMNVLGASVPQLSPYAVQYVLTYALCLTLGLDFLLQGRASSARATRMQMEQPQLERELDAARTALLQAQVEPHFLFNTLAHLRRLAQQDPSEARAMLADLLRYLQEALPSLRRERSTLHEELALVAAYLALHQRRMGDRLRWRFDIEPGLDGVPLPATALLTLAENAIKHGLAPQVKGGEIRLSARREPDGKLLLQVADTGRGMGATAGHGTGLATLRARLHAQHGAAASLSLHLNQPQGLVVSLSLPA